MPPGSDVQAPIGDRVVNCLSAGKQLEYHQSYDPAPKDVHDMALLRGLSFDV